MAKFHSFLWLNNILSQVCVYSILCMCIYIYIHTIESSLIHLSVDEHCFHSLAIVNNPVKNIGLHNLFKLVFLCFSDVYPGVELLGHIVVLFFVFWETSITVSIVATAIHIPLNSVQVFPFLHILTTFVICLLFVDSHSDRCAVTAHCDFDLHFPDDQQSFQVPVGHLHFLFGKLYIHFFCPFLPLWEKCECSPPLPEVMQTSFPCLEKSVSTPRVQWVSLTWGKPLSWSW